MATPFDDLDAYISLPRLSGLAISPDARRLVTTVASLNEEKTKYITALWEIDPTGVRPARRLTHGAHGESAPVFTGSGDLLFTSTRPSKQDGDDDVAKLWCLPAAGGEAYVAGELPGGVSAALTAREAHAIVVNGNVHPEAKSLEEDEKIRKDRKERKVDAILHTGYPIRHWDRDLGPDYPRLFLLGEEPRDLTPDVGADLVETGAALSPDGKAIVTSLRKSLGRGDEKSTLALIDVETGDRRIVFEEEEAFAASFSPDGSLIAFIVETIPDPHTAPNMHVWVMDADGTNPRNLSGDWDRWPTSLTWLPDSSGLLVTADDDGRGPIFHLTLAGEVRKVTNTDTTFTDVVCVERHRAFAVQSSYALPGEVVSVDLESGDVTRLANPHERPALPGELRDVETTASDGVRVRSWLALPEGASAENPAPLLLWIHGGPLNSWNAWSWRWNPWLAVAQGYAVLLPDPALSTGYGQEFIQRGWGNWGGAPYTDLMAATDAALELPEIDEQRTAAMGGSFGGYMANWVAGHTDRFNAIVTHASLWNLHSFGPTTDAAFYWAKEMTPAMAAANSPHAHVSKIVTPMLVIHGDKDYRVPIGEGLALWYQLLAESGLPAREDGSSEHQFLYFPNENHWVLTPQHAKLWYETVFAFLDARVGGE